MSDREVARLYIAEMRALLPVLRGHLNTLGSSSQEEQRAVAANELRRLAGAAADLSADFHAGDCAGIAAALARAVSSSPSAPLSLPPCARGAHGIGAARIGTERE